MNRESQSSDVEAAAEALRAGIDPLPRLAIVLGSGLGEAIAELRPRASLAFADVPGFPATTVPGHSGRFVFGDLGGTPVVVMQGRVHAYEGHDAHTVVLGVRALRKLGVASFLLTNAAGGIREDLEPGMLLRITDHLNLTGLDPGQGLADGELGPRFTNLVDAWQPSLGEKLDAVARDLGIPLTQGIYAGRLGPSYETPAEIRMLRTLGADAIGMSTVLENLALVQMGAAVAGLSCITNRAAGRPGAKLDHADVQANAAAMARDVGRLVLGLAKELGR